jgi:anti-anti-sigma regulatory factor
MERNVSVHVTDGLKLEVERGPNWLFVKLRPHGAPLDKVPHIADKLWSIASRHFIYRLVLELDELETMPSEMMSQLVLLQERLAQCDGALRICGMSPECEETFHECAMETALLNHSTRAEAVMGSGEYAPISRAAHLAH